jgi:hypothetical protein
MNSTDERAEEAPFHESRSPKLPEDNDDDDNIVPTLELNKLATQTGDESDEHQDFELQTALERAWQELGEQTKFAEERREFEFLRPSWRRRGMPADS